MAEPQGMGSRHPDVSVPSAGPPMPATPRWVKVTGIVTVLLVLALLATALVGGGHGPGQHGGLGSLAPPPASSTAPQPARATPGL
jgi:hypothetical protein